MLKTLNVSSGTGKLCRLAAHLRYFCARCVCDE